MWHAITTILVFMGWGLAWGTVLGILSGTLIFPVFGTLYGVIWGMGMGGIMGAVTGVLAAVSDALFRREKMNLQRYRRRLALVSGTITAAGVAMMLIALAQDIPGGTSVTSSFGLVNSPFLVLALIAGSGWSCLAAAYTATRHVDSNLNDALRDDRINSAAVPLQLMQRAAHRWTLTIGAAAGLVTHLYNRNTWAVYERPVITPAMQLRLVIEGIFGGMFIALGDIFLLGLANGFLLLFINRLYVKEYAPHLTRDQYKLRVTILTFAFTLFAGFLVSAFLLAPVSAAIAALAARSYADWLYDDADKFKRRAKEDDDTVRLEAADFDADHDQNLAELARAVPRHPAKSSLS